jgi:hypothetical protein
MDLSLILDNFLSPPILFFFLGVLAVLVKSDLEIPQPIPKLLSLYLLFAIGFKGGVELTHSGLSGHIFITLLMAVIMASIVPFYAFYILRTKLNIHDSAAIAATYGSISAVTFITAISYLENLEISYGGHLVAAMALMESPAIVVGVLLHRLYNNKEDQNKIDWKELIRDAFLNGSVFLILGSLVIGFITGEKGNESLKPFTDDIFKGVLVLFLLDMGLIAAKRLNSIKKAGGFIFMFSLLLPILNALVGLVVSYYIGLSIGDALLFTILCASASYIAVPAAVRLIIPEANPSYYIAMSLGITFPLNIILGIPFYMYLINLFWS